MKPRVSYAEFQAAKDGAWMAAFEKIKALGKGAELADGWKVLWVHEDPNWVQLGRKKERRMVRMTDPIQELVATSANGNERNSTKERT